MKIGIVIGSVRKGRKGEAVGHWVHELASARGDAEYELIDLKSFDLPIFTAPTMPSVAGRVYEEPEVRAWSAAIDGCDGFVFVTTEYNHGVPGAFKNAIDSLGPEWVGKTVGFVSYGADNGIRAVEHWRQIIGNFQMVDVRAICPLSNFTDFGEDGFAPGERRAGEVGIVLDQLVAMTARLTV